MASLSSVALPLAMAAIVSLAVFALLVEPAAGQFSGLPPAQPLQPPCRTPSTQSAALQDAVEGIAGLMQRFEDLQPQIGQLPATELQQIAQPAQKLHERFENMQKKLVAINGNAGPELEEEAITFHRDLAVFVNGVARRFGITGPRSQPGAAGVATGPSGDASGLLGGFGGRRSPGGLAGGAGAASPATEQRLQAAMQAIQSGMQRFESLHQKLATLPAQVLNPLADQAQRLHEEFLRLQQKGMQLASGQLMLEADAAPYADELESYMSRQLTFVGDAEYQVKQAAAPSSTGYSGMLGSRLSPAAPGGAGPSLGSLPSQNAAPQVSMGSMGLGAGPMPMQAVPGQVTPETDRRLSAIIEKVIRLMQDFQGLAPQLSRIPQQVLAPLANVGTSLDTRFRELQRRGTEIAGDSTRPMTEKDASQYLRDMEAFYSEQERYVEQAKQALQAAPAAAPGLGGGIGLGSARLEDLRGPAAQGGGFGGLPGSTGLGGMPRPTGLGGLGGFGGKPPGAPGAPSGTGLGNSLHPSISVNNFGTATLGGRSFGRSGDYRSSEAPGLPNLEEMGRATLNTAVLPHQRGACSAGVCGESSL